MVVSHYGIRWYSDNPETAFKAEDVLPVLHEATKIPDLVVGREQFGSAQVIHFPGVGNELVKLKLLQATMIGGYGFVPTWVVLKTGETQFITWDEHLGAIGKMCAEVAARRRPVYLGL